MVFNLEGIYFMQGIDYRIADSDWFVGAKYAILNSQMTFY